VHLNVVMLSVMEIALYNICEYLNSPLLTFFILLNDETSSHSTEQLQGITFAAKTESIILENLAVISWLKKLPEDNYFSLFVEDGKFFIALKPGYSETDPSCPL